MRQLLLLCILLTLTTVGRAKDIPKNPVSNEKNVKKNLFELDTLDIRYYFRSDLPENNFLTMEFEKLSYWPAGKSISKIFTAARDVVTGLRDSFAKPGTSKRIDVYMPLKDEPMIVRYTEHNDNGNLVLMNKGGNMPLKLGMDTIRIMKTYNDTTGSKNVALARIQYTFILKDLEQIYTLDNSYVTDSVQTTFDKLVNDKRETWQKQDAWHHTMDAWYNMGDNSGSRLTVRSSTGIMKRVDLDGNIGMSLFRNTIAPNFDLGVSYKWLNKQKDYYFVQLSGSNISFFDQGNVFGLQASNILFLNLETGTLFNKKNTLVPLYKASVGVGYKVTQAFAYTVLGGNYYTLFVGRGYRIFFKYSLSKAITVMPDLYIFSDPRVINGPPINTRFVGVTVYFRLI